MKKWELRAKYEDLKQDYSSLVTSNEWSRRREEKLHQILATTFKVFFDGDLIASGSVPIDNITIEDGVIRSHIYFMAGRVMSPGEMTIELSTPALDYWRSFVKQTTDILDPFDMLTISVTDRLEFTNQPEYTVAPTGVLVSTSSLKARLDNA